MSRDILSHGVTTMNFSTARTMAAVISSAMASVHTHVNALKSAADGPDGITSAKAIHGLESAVNNLHRRLGDADMAGYALFAGQASALGIDLRQATGLNPEGPFTLSGGTPKDDPVVQPEREAGADELDEALADEDVKLTESDFDDNDD